MNNISKILSRYNKLLGIDKVIEDSNLVYSFAAWGLGDHCRIVNYLLNNKMLNVTLISRRPALDYQILNLFNIDNNIKICSSKMESKEIFLRRVNIGKYLQFKNCWKLNNNNKKIIAQLNGAHSSGKRKNCSDEDIAKLNDFMNKSGYVINQIQSDKYPLIKDVVNEMANSRLFIGVESGWAHIAHSSGIPCIIIKNSYAIKKFFSYHIGNEYTLYKDVDDLISHFDIESYRPNFG